MANEFDPLQQYADEPALRRQTDFILSLFDEVEKRGLDAAQVLQKSFNLFDGKSGGLKSQIDDINQLQLTSANYQKVLAAVAAEMGNLTDQQKKTLQAINEQFKAEEQLRAGARETTKLIATEINQIERIEAGRSRLAQTLANNNFLLKQETLERNRLAAVLGSENASMQKSQAVIDLLINKKKKLNLETEQGQRVNEAFNKTIEREREFILKNADVETKRIKNIGNYSSALDGVTNSLKNMRGPSKVLAEVFGLGKEQVDDIRILITDITEGLSEYFKKKAAKAAAESADTAATAANSAAMAQQATTTAAATGTTNTFTVATAAATGALGAEAVAATTASRATALFLNILKYSGIALIVTAFAALAYQLYQVSKNMFGLSEQQKQLRDSFIEAAGGAGEEIAKLELIKVKLNDTNIPLDDRNRLLAQYNKTAEEGNKINEKDIDNLSILNAQIEKQIELIKKRALAKGAENLVAKAAEDLFQKQIQLEFIQEQFPDASDSALQNILDLANKKIADAAKKNKNAFKLTAEEALSFAAFSDADLQKIVQGNARVGLLVDQQLVAQLRSLAQRKKLIDDARTGDRGGTGYGFIKGAKDDVKEAEDNLNKLVNLASRYIDVQSLFDTANAKKDNLQALKERINVEFEIYKIRQTAKIRDFERDMASDKTHYLDKLSILANYMAASTELINRQEQEDIRIAREKTAREKQRLEEERAGKSPAEIARINANIAILEKNLVDEIRVIREKAGDQLVQLAASISDKRYKILQTEFDREKDLYDEFAKHEQAVMDATQKRYQTALDKRQKQEEDAAKKLIELNLELYEKKLEAAKAGEELILGLIGATYTRQLNFIKEQQDNIDRQKDAQLLANDQIQQSEQDKAANIIIINTRAQIEKEKLDRKSKQLQLEQAKFQRLQQAFEIGISTIKSIAEIKAKAATLLASGNPLIAALAAKALAQIPLVLASSGAALALLFATPLPRFFKGKGAANNYSGLGLLNDHPDGKTKEVIERESGEIEFVEGRNVVRHIGKNDIIHPDSKRFMNNVKNVAMAYALRTLGYGHESHPNGPNNGEMMGAMRQQTRLLADIANKPTTHHNASRAGMMNLIRWGSNQHTYIDSNTNW